MIGRQLGPYRIKRQLGAGGMGEVYLAVDSRLDREVAIKILPPEASEDDAMIERFRREARAISSLSHSNICALYDIGHEQGTDYLVMELLEGETLAERLARGALPLDQALAYAAQIADALGTAHRRGIVHRDLKPGNVMLTGTGIKLLDFGLAKLQKQPAALEGGAPTAVMTAKAPLTGEGTILGTFQYMSPEQIEGQPVDERSDIFAFGALLYEMVTGRPAFGGASPASLIGAIMHSEPTPLGELLAVTPPALDRIVRKCLAKQPDQRWQNAMDLRDELIWIAENPLLPVNAKPARRSLSTYVGWGAAALLALALAAAWTLSPPPQPAATIWAEIQPPGDISEPGVPVLSPDGRQLVFEASNRSGQRQLFVRNLGARQAQPLAGTEGATLPFFSPDGRSLAFFAGGSLRRLDLAEGRITTLYEGTGFGAAGSWAGDGQGHILFTPNIQEGLLRITGSGSRPITVTEPDLASNNFGHAWPHLLPDGKHFLYAQIAGKGAGIHIGHLEEDRSALLVPFGEVATTGVQYTDSGHLVYLREGDLYAQRLDLDKLELVGEPARVAEGINFYGPGFAAFSVSRNGHLVYQEDPGWATWQTIWVDQNGTEIEAVGPPGPYYDARNPLNVPQLSPNGRWLAMSHRLPKRKPSLWLLDMQRQTSLPFASHGYNSTPVWSPDSDAVVFGKVLERPPELYLKSLDSNEAEQPLLPAADGLAPERWPNSWSPSGRYIMFAEQTFENGWDLFVLDQSEQPGAVRPYTRLSSHAQAGAIAPNERWALYLSNLSGRYEVYLSSFPEHGRQIQVSRGIRGAAFWSHDGREIFYPGPDGALMSVSVLETEGEPVLSEPVRILEPITPPPFAVSIDGERFLTLRREQDPETPLYTLVLNWSTNLP
jgi:eukaryotic-like serine/threonine-protein kinase